MFSNYYGFQFFLISFIITEVLYPKFQQQHLSPTRWIAPIRISMYKLYKFYVDGIITNKNLLCIITICCFYFIINFSNMFEKLNILNFNMYYTLFLPVRLSIQYIVITIDSMPRENDSILLFFILTKRWRHHNRKNIFIFLSLLYFFDAHTLII